MQVKSQLRLSGGRKLHSPKGVGTRPTTAKVREAVMNILGQKIQGCNWLDLCSGSGVMSCEALQRGARRVLAVEKDKQTARICQTNICSIATALGEESFVEVICQEVISLLRKGCQHSQVAREQRPKFDIVYFDPPYESKIHSIVFEKLLEGNWLKQDSLVICEHSSSCNLDAPDKWTRKGERIYGRTALLLISPP